MTMTPQTEAVDLVSIAVAIGRLETKVDRLHAFEARLRTVEDDVTAIKASNKPRAPWYVIASGFAGVAAFLAFALDALGKLL